MSYGVGIGAFLDGLTKGVQLKRGMDADKRREALDERRMKLAEGADARSAENEKWQRGITERQVANSEENTKFNQGMQTKQFGLQERQVASGEENTKFNQGIATQQIEIQKQQQQQRAEAEAENRKWAREDRAADAPVKEVQRKGILDAASDQSAIRDASKSAAGEAKSAFESQPPEMPKFKTFADAYVQIAVPKLQQAYLERGDRAGADAIGKWASDQRVKQGIEAAGKATSALAQGDWVKANEHLNELLKNSHYIDTGGAKISAEPIKDSKGAVIGLRSTIINKDGTKAVQDHTDIASFADQISAIINPAANFERLRSQADTARATKADITKENNKTANAIAVERVKGEIALDKAQMEAAGRIAAERAKTLNIDPTEYTKGVMDAWKRLSEDTGFMKTDASGKRVVMSAEEQAALAAKIYEQVRMQGGTIQQRQKVGPVPQQAVPDPTTAQPKQRSLFSR